MQTHEMREETFTVASFESDFTGRMALNSLFDRFQDIAVAMGLDVARLTTRQAAEKMIENLYALNKDLNIPSGIAAQGLTEADLDGLVEAASKVTRLLENNPKPLAKSDMRAIYRRLL